MNVSRCKCNHCTMQFIAPRLKFSDFLPFCIIINEPQDTISKYVYKALLLIRYQLCTYHTSYIHTAVAAAVIIQSDRSYTLCYYMTFNVARCYLWGNTIIHCIVIINLSPQHLNLYANTYYCIKIHSATTID